MSKLAFDIALLPPDKVMDQCIAVNHEANKKGLTKDKLNKTDFLPHITLFMGAASNGEIKKITQKLAAICQKNRSFTITLYKLHNYNQPNHPGNYALLAKKTKTLQRLRQTIIKEMREFLTTQGTSAMFYKKKSEKGEPSPIHLNQYGKRTDFKNFSPHITLRTTHATYNKFPITFPAVRLVLAHMGVNSTCRKILWETKLTSV